MRLRLADDTLLVSASHRRYITFVIGRDDKARVVARTDNRDKAAWNHRHHVGRWPDRMNVVVTTDANGGTPKVLYNRWYGGVDA